MFADEHLPRQSESPPEPCATVAQLVPAHSIGATDADEATIIHALLTECPDAAAELAQYSELATRLLYCAPLVAPPPALAERLLAATAGGTTLRSGTPGPTLPHPAAVASPAAARASQPPINKPGGRRWSFSYLTAVAASLILLLLNGAFLVQNRQLQAQQAVLAAELAQQNRALILLSAEEPQEVELFDPAGVTAAQADILWNTSLGIAVLYVRAFPASQPEQAYQIWLNQGNEKTSGGLFRVDDSGMGLLVFPLPQPLDAYDSIGITPEPKTGSPGPTAPPVVRGPI